MEKIALVTGSSRGIGRAVAAQLARDGWAVCINYRVRQDCAEDLAARLAAQGCRCMVRQADVSDRAQVNDMVHALEDTFGPASLLVNNAGVAGQALFQDITDELWHRYFLRQRGRGLSRHPGGAAPHAPRPRGLHRQHLLHLGPAGRQL